VKALTERTLTDEFMDMFSLQNTRAGFHPHPNSRGSTAANYSIIPDTTHPFCQWKCREDLHGHEGSV
jgi:hypothetical protein